MNPVQAKVPQNQNVRPSVPLQPSTTNPLSNPQQPIPVTPLSGQVQKPLVQPSNQAPAGARPPASATVASQPISKPSVTDPVTPGNKQILSVLDKQDLKDILVEIGRLLLMTQIYKSSHPIVQEKLSSLSLLIIKIANKHGRLVLSNREDFVFLNGYQEKVAGGPLEKLKDTLKYLKVASFEFEKGITQQEIASFFDLMASQKRAREAGNIKELLKKVGIVHVKPIFLQYVEVDDEPKEVPKPKNVIEGTKHGVEKGFAGEEQIIKDFLKGKISEMPKKVDTFLLKHPKTAAMVIIKLLDEFESQGLDSFNAFQAYTQSMSHYMARLSRLVKNPDTVEKTLEKLEKHLVVHLKSLKKDRKFINEARHQIKDALTWVEVEELLSHYDKAEKKLSSEEENIIDSIEKRKIPNIAEFKERLKKLGFFESKLAGYIK